VEADGENIHIPDLTGSSYQDIAADEEQEQFTDWSQLLQPQVLPL
jgi:hypothetical protein